MRKSSFIHRLTKILIDVMFYGGIVVCISLPFIMENAMRMFGYAYDARELRTLFIGILGSAGLCAVYILYQLKRIFKSLLQGDPFVHANVSSLRKCGVASFLIAMIFMVRLGFSFTLASSIVVVIFVLLGLFSLTLKDVFKQAVAYKEENDWTV